MFHTSGDLSESKLELILERFYKGEPIQQSELPEDETVEADVLSISVPRNMFTDDKLENLQKLIEGKQTLFKHAFRVEQLEVAITENQVSFPVSTCVRAGCCECIYRIYFQIMRISNKTKTSIAEG